MFEAGEILDNKEMRKLNSMLENAIAELSNRITDLRQYKLKMFEYLIRQRGENLPPMPKEEFYEMATSSVEKVSQHIGYLEGKIQKCLTSIDKMLLEGAAQFKFTLEDFLKMSEAKDADETAENGEGKRTVSE